MNAMPVVPWVDPKPVLELIKEKGGECSFDEAMNALVELGMTQAAARDGLWRLLSDGQIEFTTDRHLTIPKR
jgi:DNA-binding transcriptional regulator PaaX